jgi:hypothetical protein
MKKVLGLLVVLFMIGCQPLPPEKEQHSEKIYLRQLVNRDVTETHTSGSFFLIDGSINSSTETNTVVKLMGKVRDEYRFIQFDFEKVRIKIDNKVTTPYIILNYTDREVIETDKLLKYTGYLDSVTIVCPEQYLPEKLLPIQI